MEEQKRDDPDYLPEVSSDETTVTSSSSPENTSSSSSADDAVARAVSLSGKEWRPRKNPPCKTLTKLRQEVLERFLRDFRLNPGQFAPIGSDEWVRAAIECLRKRSKRSAANVTKSDVLQWVQSRKLAELYQECQKAVQENAGGKTSTRRAAEEGAPVVQETRPEVKIVAVVVQHGKPLPQLPVAPLLPRVTQARAPTYAEVASRPPKAIIKHVNRNMQADLRRSEVPYPDRGNIEDIPVLRVLVGQGFIGGRAPDSYPGKSVTDFLGSPRCNYGNDDEDTEVDVENGDSSPEKQHHDGSESQNCQNEVSEPSSFRLPK